MVNVKVLELRAQGFVQIKHLIFLIDLSSLRVGPSVNFGI